MSENQMLPKGESSEQPSGEGLSSSVLLSLLQSLLEGLECRETEKLIADASPEKMRMLGFEIAKAAKLGASFYRRGMGDPILCDNVVITDGGGQPQQTQ
jgi:hypothetical protein